jgi:hypothetical protein
VTTLGAHNGSRAELEWLFNEAPAAVGGLRSTFRDGVEVLRGRPPGFVIDGLWYPGELRLSGKIHVGSTHMQEASYEIEDSFLAAAARERRLWAAVVVAAWEAHWVPAPAVPPLHVLRLRFREVIPAERRVFGLPGFAALGARPLDRVRHVAARGPGILAHLTLAAAQAWGRERTQLELARWVDRLGSRLAAGKAATPGERELGGAIRAECALLEDRALVAFERARQRVPERVRRAALARLG